MGKSASREDRGKRSSFSVSYEGGGQRDASTQVKLGRLSYKGPATAVVAVAAVATVGVIAYQWLDGQKNTGGTGSGPGTSVTSSDTNAPTSGPDTAAPATGATTAPAPATSSPSTAPPGGATQAAAAGDAGAAVVREHRKVVLRSADNVDLDFAKGSSDIGVSMPTNGNGWTLSGDNGDLATVEGPATAESCKAATDFGYTIDQKNISKGLTACVLTDENRVAAITVLGWQKGDSGLSSITMDVTTWENPEAQ